MHWLLVGYMFLFIHRPGEVWPALDDFRVERVYMLVVLAAWAVYPNKRWLGNVQHGAYAAFAFAVLSAWVLSPWAATGQPAVEDWFKVVVFYVLLVTTVHDEEGLKRLAVGFVGVMALYLLHSFREYLGGKYTFRMGIARMVGVDTSLGDPNSFGMSIVFALPMAAALWKSNVGGSKGKVVLLGYVGLSALCILLTGSRSSLLGLILWSSITILGHRRRFLFLAAAFTLAPVAFLALPESLQTRFETIVNPDAGPANAKESGEGRIEGLFTGLQLWAANPLTGVGPGAWRPATGRVIESHNLYGQLVGETGTLGLLAFLALLACFWVNLRAVKRVRKAYPEWRDDFVFQLPAAVGTVVFLLLFLGNFGHNLFRFNWLWYGGFLIIARHCVAARVAAWDGEPEDDPDEEYEDDAEETLPPGWVYHPSHALPRG